MGREKDQPQSNTVYDVHDMNRQLGEYFIWFYQFGIQLAFQTVIKTTKSNRKGIYFRCYWYCRLLTINTVWDECRWEFSKITLRESAPMKYLDAALPCRLSRALGGCLLKYSYGKEGKTTSEKFFVWLFPSRCYFECKSVLYGSSVFFAQFFISGFMYRFVNSALVYSLLYERCGSKCFSFG